MALFTSVICSLLRSSWGYTLGFSPSTTNNKLQIIMIMKISNDINKIDLAVLGMSIWPMFLHLFSCSSSLSNISRLSGLSVNLADSFYLHCSPFPKSHFEFQSISIFFLCDFLFLGSISAPFHTQVCPTLIIDWWVFQVAPRNLPKFISWIPDAKLVLICSKVPVWICDAKRVRFVENRRGRICDAKHL